MRPALVIDAHLHCTGGETTDALLRALDEACIDMAVLLAPFLSDGDAMHDAASLRLGNSHLARLGRDHADGLVGFAVVNPGLPGRADDLRAAIDTGLSGAKMLPGGWSAHHDRVQPTFAVASQLQLPLLLHSGTVIDGRSSGLCRPAGFEALHDHPGAPVPEARVRVTALCPFESPRTDGPRTLGCEVLVTPMPAANGAHRAGRA